MFKGMFNRYKYSFLTGLIVVTPLLVTILVILFILSFYYKRFTPLINLAIKTGIPYPHLFVPAVGTALGILVIIFIGMFTQNVVGKKLFGVWEMILQKVPFISTVYSLIKQFVETLLSYQRRGFKSVALIEWPRKGLYVIGFITAENREDWAPGKRKKKVFNVFLPTTPNPTSGYMIIVPEDELTIVDMKVEEAVKLVVSGGIVSKKNLEITEDSLQ